MKRGFTLWDSSLKSPHVTYEDVRRLYERKPTDFRPLWQIASQRLIIAQELVMVVYLWARYRVVMQEDDVRDDLVMLSNAVVLVAQALVIVYGLRADREHRSTRARERLIGALWMAAFLRLLSALLRSLTASYSSDTVHSVAQAALALHWMTCDYVYAQGHTMVASKTFQGGAISLNAAFLAVILLVSRFPHDSDAYLFVCTAVALFALYPRTRNAICARYPPQSHAIMWIITLLMSISTMFLLLGDTVTWFLGGLVALLVVSSAWEAVLQHGKIVTRGPWDVPTTQDLRLDDHN